MMPRRSLNMEAAMGNGNLGTHGARYKCEICHGKDGDELVDPHTGDQYRVRVANALPLHRRNPGDDEWRVEPICEHCSEVIKLAARAAGATIMLYHLKTCLDEAQRRNTEIVRLRCKITSVIRNCGTFHESDNEGGSSLAAENNQPDRGSS